MSIRVPKINYCKDLAHTANARFSALADKIELFLFTQLGVTVSV